jgi:hypothetical protein
MPRPDLPSPSDGIPYVRRRTYVNRMTGAEEQLFIRGDWFDRRGQIMLGAPDGPVVAAITRQVAGVGRTLLGQQTYVLHVAPNGEYISASVEAKVNVGARCPLGDLAMMSALCVCLDDLVQKKL